MFYTFLISFLSLGGCKEDPRKAVDTDEVEAEVQIRYFHRDFFSMREDQLESDLDRLKAEYGSFYPFFKEDIMGWEDDEELNNCRLLLNDTHVMKIRDTVALIFGDFTGFEKIIRPAFKRFAYHFPELPLPQIIFAYTEFLFRSGTDSQHLVLAPELCLGEAYPVYGKYNIPAFVAARLDKHHLPAVAMNAWLDEWFGELPVKNTCLDHMIREGKKLYYMELMLPDLPDSLRTDWTGSQLEWLKENEVQIWTYFIENKYLYNTDPAYFMPVLMDGPFTAAPNIPPGSAPRIGAYTGWLIVKKYMQKNPEISLKDLFADLDSEKILRESGYRP